MKQILSEGREYRDIMESILAPYKWTKWFNFEIQKIVNFYGEYINLSIYFDSIKGLIVKRITITFDTWILLKRKDKETVGHFRKLLGSISWQ